MIDRLMLPAREQLYLSVPAMVASQIRHADKEHMKTVCAAVLRFGFERGLLKDNPFDQGGRLRCSVDIYERNLTDHGKLYFNDLIYKWLEYTDRTNKIDNVKMLDKWYDKMTR